MGRKISRYFAGKKSKLLCGHEAPEERPAEQYLSSESRRESSSISFSSMFDSKHECEEEEGHSGPESSESSSKGDLVDLGTPSSRPRPEGRGSPGGLAALFAA